MTPHRPIRLAHHRSLPCGPSKLQHGEHMGTQYEHMGYYWGLRELVQIMHALTPGYEPPLSTDSVNDGELQKTGADELRSLHQEYDLSKYS